MVERPGSNRRHLAPQASALPTELHPTYFKERERWFSGQSLLQLALLVVVQTPMILTSHLYQVFHITIPQSTLIVIPVGFEPTTSTLEGWRSIQLSYRTKCSDLSRVAAGSPIGQIWPNEVAKSGLTLSLGCTWGGNRTRTDFTVQQILSLSCLPISTPRQKGAGGRSGYLHGVHFGFTTFSRITGRLIISIRIRDHSFRHTGIYLLAERKGFEPLLRSLVNTLSKRAPSASRTPL